MPYCFHLGSGSCVVLKKCAFCDDRFFVFFFIRWLAVVTCHIVQGMIHEVSERVCVQWSAKGIAICVMTTLNMRLTTAFSYGKSLRMINNAEYHTHLPRVFVFILRLKCFFLCMVMYEINFIPSWVKTSTNDLLHHIIYKHIYWIS